MAIKITFTRVFIFLLRSVFVDKHCLNFILARQCRFVINKNNRSQACTSKNLKCAFQFFAPRKKVRVRKLRRSRFDIRTNTRKLFVTIQNEVVNFSSGKVEIAKWKVNFTRVGQKNSLKTVSWYVKISKEHSWFE